MLKLFSFRTMAIIKRELRAQIMNKTFIFTTIFVPVIMVGLMSLQTFLMMFEDKKVINVEVIVENVQLLSMIEQEYKQSDDFNHEMFHLVVSKKSRNDLDTYIQTVKPKLLDSSLNGVFLYHREKNTIRG
ncbi:MAG: hypothetical protein Q9M92_15525 [Enterobacterales bacterium]|nr:hypothetical protein [Enterobacterales bacterium]